MELASLRSYKKDLTRQIRGIRTRRAAKKMKTENAAAESRLAKKLAGGVCPPPDKSPAKAGDAASGQSPEPPVSVTASPVPGRTPATIGEPGRGVLAHHGIAESPPTRPWKFGRLTPSLSAGSSRSSRRRPSRPAGMDTDNHHVGYGKVIPLLGKAGSIAVHHFPAVYGSAASVSDHDRRPLLFQFRRAGARALFSFPAGIEKFNQHLVAGFPSERRREQSPVPLAIVASGKQDSLHEDQKAMKNRFFATPELARAPEMAK